VMHYNEQLPFMEIIALKCLKIDLFFSRKRGFRNPWNPPCARPCRVTIFVIELQINSLLVLRGHMNWASTTQQTNLKKFHHFPFIVIFVVLCILGFHSITGELKDNSGPFGTQLVIIETDDKSFVNCTPMTSSASQLLVKAILLICSFHLWASFLPSCLICSHDFLFANSLFCTNFLQWMTHIPG